MVNKHMLMLEYLLHSTLCFPNSRLPLPRGFPSLTGIVGTERAAKLFPYIFGFEGAICFISISKTQTVLPSFL